MFSLNRYAYSIYYAFFTALSLVIIEDTNAVNTATSLFICSILATLYFHFVIRGNIVATYKKIYAHSYEWAYASLTILIVWIATVYATKTIGPVNTIFAFFIARAITAYIILLYLNPTKRMVELFSLIGLSAILCYLFYQPHVLHIHKLDFVIACVGGIASYFYGSACQLLHNRTGFSPSQILAVRFFILILATAFFVNYSTLPAIVHIYWFNLFLAAAFTFIIPLYLNQRGIIQAGPELHAVISAATPIFVILLNLCFIYSGQIEKNIILGLMITVLISFKPITMLYAHIKPTSTAITR